MQPWLPFCQPGYTFLPVRERSTEDLVKLSKASLDNSGHQEYSMLSLCVSDYTVLHESVKALNLEHSSRRASLSFPSQRADRMNLDLADSLKTVRKSGITLAPEAGTERLRAVINKGLNHDQIISAVRSAYESGWSSIKLYFMIGLPTETDEDLAGIINILKDATSQCQTIKRSNPSKYRRTIDLTCTLSNTVPKPFTPFQWYGQISIEETLRKQQVLKNMLKESGLKNITLNFTDPNISMLESVISRGDRTTGEIIFKAWQAGAIFDAWDEHFKPQLWQSAAIEKGESLTSMACTTREVGSDQPWDIVHVGLNSSWLVNEWEKAMAAAETPNCTENTCHACGVCTELSTTHLLANAELGKKNPFVKELAAQKPDDSHPSIFFTAPSVVPTNNVSCKICFEWHKKGEMRFISHLDVQHLLTRALRRARINVAFTEGFNPSPKLSLAMSLPLFQEATAEIGVVELSEELDAGEFQQRLNLQLPAELQISRAKVISNGGPSLASLVGRATYFATPNTDTQNGVSPQKFVQTQIQNKIDEIMSSTCLLVSEQDKKPVDIRSGIYSLKIESACPLGIELILAAGSKMHIKPSCILNILDPEIIWKVTRKALTTPEGVSLFDVSVNIV